MVGGESTRQGRSEGDEGTFKTFFLRPCSNATRLVNLVTVVLRAVRAGERGRHQHFVHPIKINGELSVPSRPFPTDEGYM